MRARSLPRAIDRMSVPPTVIRPASGSRKRRRSAASVDLPHPLGPMMATVSPGPTCRSIPSSTVRPPGYANRTPSKRMPPAGSGACGPSAAPRTSSAASSAAGTRMASSRSSATTALPRSASMRPRWRIGQMYMLVANRKKKNSPAPSVPPETSARPTTSTRRSCPRQVMSLSAQNCESPSKSRMSASRCSALRARNSSFSNSCRPNARTTRMPEMFSWALAVRRPSASSLVRKRSLTVRK